MTEDRALNTGKMVSEAMFRVGMLSEQLQGALSLRFVGHSGLREVCYLRVEPGYGDSKQFPVLQCSCVLQRKAPRSWTVP